MPTLITVIRPWSQTPGYVAYAEAEYKGKKYVYDPHYSIWKDDPEDTYSGIDDTCLENKLNELLFK